jgi:nucleotide-binding universal stress UspA family protein
VLESAAERDVTDAENIMTTMNPTGAGVQSLVSRILVATDFSLPSESALEWGRRLADAFEAKLVLLHVVDIFGLAELGCRMVGGDPLLPILRKEASDGMQRWQTRVPGIEGIIVEGSPRPIIVESAVELQCQMIIMGTHGRSGLAHLLMGSVAEYVVRHSKVPVLTVRA